ncbi:hypothetical protein TKK_0007380 [Trichogramma kaykai]|uniref:PRANC domain-containing protein n=1 Tax=Trichogramma kaykai TaxID=54128 RepID=A0ABD2WGZ6_9HYME
MGPDNEFKVFLLRLMRKRIVWENEDIRLKFLEGLHIVIENWIDGLPNLRDIFQGDEIERLLVDAINYDDRDASKNALVHRFIRFVISTGYRDEPKLDEEGNMVLRRNTPVHLAGKKESVFFSELFDIYNSFDVNLIDESGYTHFHAACSSCCTDVVKKFLEHGQDPDCLPREPNQQDPPIHLALNHRRKAVCELLLSHGANPNLTSKDGLTPLHRICRYHSNADFLELFFNSSKRPLQVNARDKFGNTPLHAAVHRKCLKMIEVLLRRGADPSLANKRGVTPLLLMVDGRDTSGRTLLHVVMDLGHLNLMEFLLKIGADPNAADNDGETPLHTVSRYAYLNYLAQNFFEICDAEKITLKLDAKDKRGWTPLHLAINSGSRYIAESLLARGADPNLPNDDGETLLHVICSQGDDKTAKLFFDICDERKQTVRLDAKDNLGRTPLRYAVSKVEARLVDLLLERGADPSNLVFLTEHEISEQLNDLPVALRVLYPSDFLSKWRRASRVATVVESLAKKGYAFDVSQVQSIVKALIRHGLLEMSLEPDERLCLVRYLYSSSEFSVKAKEITVTSSLSLYDLLKLRPEETKKLLTSAHYFGFADSGDLELLGTKELVEICVVLLCNMMMERFCKLLALVPFLTLTRYRLPISHCEIILEKLPNEDLFELCLLANGQN